MHVQFVLQWPVLTGGVRVVYEHASQLLARGHRVTLLVPPVRLPRPGASMLSWKHYLAARLRGGNRDALRSYALEEAVVPLDVGALAKVPAADAVVATAWVTAEWVAAMPERAGRKFYLVQQYEAWSEGTRERVDATWKLPLRKIVIAGWLERLARERFGERAWRIPNGVDATRFHPGNRVERSPGTVGMIYDALPWKGATEGFEALTRVRAAMPDTRLLVLGRGRLRHPLPSGARYVRDPRQADLPDVYRDSDIFLSSSRSEGFSLITLEAMACGCALVATDVGEVPEMGQPGEQYMMVPARDARAMADAILALLRDPVRRSSIAAAGLELARSYTWKRATDRLEEVLNDA